MYHYKGRFNLFVDILVIVIVTVAITLGVDRIGVTNMGKNRGTTSHVASPAKKEETPEQVFARLAKSRTNRAIKSIRLVGQLSSSAYVRTESQANAIVLALEVAVEGVKGAFAGTGKADDTFSLPE